MNITVLYFAGLAETCNQATESISVDAGITLPQLYARLQTKHGFELDMSQLKVAINDHFAQWDDPIEDGDVIAFIPPVAGG